MIEMRRKCSKVLENVMQGIRFQENVIELFYFDLVLKSKKYLINHNQKVSHFRCSIFEQTPDNEQSKRKYRSMGVCLYKG